VAVIITGSELCRPGERLLPGKIYDSNSTIIKTLLRASGAELLSVKRVKDVLKAVTAAIESAAARADLIITSGGVSVGDYDLVKEAAAKSEQSRFLEGGPEARQAPGLLSNEKRLRAGLDFRASGKPGAVMISFEEYVRPFIKKISGRQDFWPREVEAALVLPFKKKKGRLNFVRVRLETVEGTWRATPASKQESGMLSSLTETDGLALIPAEAEFLPEGTKVRVHLVEW